LLGGVVILVLVLFGVSFILIKYETLLYFLLE